MPDPYHFHLQEEARRFKGLFGLGFWKGEDPHQLLPNETKDDKEIAVKRSIKSREGLGYSSAFEIIGTR